MRVSNDLRYAPSHKRYEHRETALNLRDFPEKGEDEVSPPSPLQESKKRRGGHQSDGGMDGLKNRAGLQKAYEVAGGGVRGADGDGRGEAGEETEQGDGPSDGLQGVVGEEVEPRRAGHGRCLASFSPLAGEPPEAGRRFVLEQRGFVLGYQKWLVLTEFCG